MRHDTDLIPLEAQEVTSRGTGAELKYSTICLWDRGGILARQVNGVVKRMSKSGGQCG